MCKHLLLFQSLLSRVNVLLNSHVDELVLGLGLNHTGSLLAHSLDGLWDVDVTIQPLESQFSCVIFYHQRITFITEIILYKTVTLSVYDVDKDVNHNNCACSSNPCTRMTMTNGSLDYGGKCYIFKQLC